MSTHRAISEIHLHHLDIPLAKPYPLSFVTLNSFNTILVTVHDSDGNQAWGESIPLPGYAKESFSDAWTSLIAWSQRLIGESFEGAAEFQEIQSAASPFASIALVSALETCAQKFSTPVTIPLVGTILSKKTGDIEDEVARLLEAGYRTLKLKIGWDPDTDLRNVRTVQRQMTNDCLLRLDANQGYAWDQAMDFVRNLDPWGIELLEQPFSTERWDWTANLGQHSPVPLMLDESISTEEDVRNAAATQGVKFVKFKLSKAGSIKRLLKLVQLARSLDLQVIVGNGVATDLGCLLEGIGIAGTIKTAGEMNGFLKITSPLLSPTLRVEDGAVRLPPLEDVLLRKEIVDRYLVSRQFFSV